jgi:hypothetical protein
MNVYIYQADLICEDCGRQVIKMLTVRERDEQGRFKPIEYDWPDNGNSDAWPDGPHSDGGGESDCPQHCGMGADCLNALTLRDGSKVGCFLENPLTACGYEYVREAVYDSQLPYPDENKMEIPMLWDKYYN